MKIKRFEEKFAIVADTRNYWNGNSCRRLRLLTIIFLAE